MAQKRMVHSRTRKTDDIEIHVSSLDTEQGMYTDIREYVVSLEQYGRGITFPSGLVHDVHEGLSDLIEDTAP